MDRDMVRIFRELHGLQRVQELASLRAGVRRGEALTLIVASGCNGPCDAAGQPPTASEIAAELGISPAATSQMLRNLQSRGFIRRTVDEYDRRVVRVGLTEEGKRTADAAKAVFESVIAELVCQMSGEEKENMIAILGRINRYLDEELEKLADKDHRHGPRSGKEMPCENTSDT